MASFSLTERALPELTGGVRAAPAAWIFMAVGSLAVAGYFLLPPDAKSIYYVGLGFAGVCAVYAGAVRNLPRGERLPWLLFSLGLLCQVAGDAISAVYEVHLDREPPIPSIADVFYLGGYPLLALGVLLLLRRFGRQTGRAAVLDTVVVFSAVVLVQWIFFIDPYTHVRFGNEGARLVTMAYPAVDVLLLVAVTQLLVGPGGRTVAYRLLLASIGLWVVADEIYGLDATGYQSGRWLDAFWLLAYVVWGAAALHPSMAHIAETDRRRLPRLTTTRLLLLAAALLAAPAILVLERVAHHHVHAYALGLGGAVLAGLVLLRLGGLVRAVERAGRAERVARREAEQAQRLLAYQNEQLLELDTLKDEFVSSVSHELRTPLTSISGYVELMLEEEQDEQKRSYLGIVDRNADRLLRLVADLLFSARLQGGRLELERTEVDVHRLVLHAVESARPRAEAAGVELTVAADSVPPVSGEAVRLAQLLDNLISNAVKFTPAGGRVSVHLSARDGLVRFEVSDTGIGISEQEREQLFERFFRSQSALERQIQGTGLGLYISKAIVEAHGGRIGVQSEDGEGTTFFVELPAAA
jgi:signal transduction histidine kinase